MIIRQGQIEQHLKGQKPESIAVDPDDLTQPVVESVRASAANGNRPVRYQADITASDRVLGAHLVGEMVRQPEIFDGAADIHMHFGPTSVAGNGAAAWIVDGVNVLIEGGAQDGVAKGASGGRVMVMKGLNAAGARVDGSVGKSFAYGAQSGTLIVQGYADSRACIRLSGADVVFGGEITRPVDDSGGNIGVHANLKGFACEYMTSGRVLILGDPGPYAFAGMTGGVVFQKLAPRMGFDVITLARRLAQGADVAIESIGAADITDIQELLGLYIDALELTEQYDTSARMRALQISDALADQFVRVVPHTG